MSASVEVPDVPVFVPATTVGWPEDDPNPGESPKVAYGVESLPLDEALARRHEDDLHFTAYRNTEDLRLRVGFLDPAVVAAALRRRGEFSEAEIIAATREPYSVGMVALVADVDDPVTHGTDAPARDEWREAEFPKIEALRRAHPGCFVYQTRGGYRIVFLLGEPFRICGPDGYRAWRRLYVLALANLSRRFRIIGDPSCRDWPRCYRLPRVVRDGRREERATYGDARALAAWNFVPNADDEAELDRLVAVCGAGWAQAKRSFAVAPVAPSATTRVDLTRSPCAATRLDARVQALDVRTRARRYLSRMPAAVSGQGGHAALWRCAVALVKGFVLDENTTLDLLKTHYNVRCRPAWSEAELLHKIRSARNATAPAGYLLARAR